MNKDNELNESTPNEKVVNLDSNIQISTTEDSYKTDGSVILGYRNPDNTYTVTNNVIPEKIDIEKRKKDKRDFINSQKKKATINHTLSKEAKRVQTIVALIVLILFIAVGGFFYYQKNYANKKDFSVKQVHVEFGRPASLRIADYVNLSNPDEKQFILDLSEFVPDQIGNYKYKITYGGVTKIGTIEVSDTSAPEVVLQEIKLNVGDTYTPEMFVKDCQDHSTCILTFEDGSSIKTATDPGRQSVNLIIKDKIGNQITKEATLNVKSTDLTLVCEKDYDYNYNVGYKTIEKYEISFTKDQEYKNSFLKTEHIYVDNNSYLAFKNNNQTDEYSYEDNLSKVTKKTLYTNGFNSQTSISGISRYLGDQGFACIITTE
ncbi:MAG: hypothetical protein ACI31M_04230 [Bacilli bacterium]